MADIKHHVLVVDDEPLNRDLMCRLLSRSYELSDAGSVHEALMLLTGDGPQVDIIICDQLMPGGNGTDLAVEVRERWPEIHFILVTGFDGEPEVVGAERDGLIDAVVLKPWRSAKLRELIAATLAAASPD